MDKDDPRLATHGDDKGFFIVDDPIDNERITHSPGEINRTKLVDDRYRAAKQGEKPKCQDPAISKTSTTGR